MKLFTLDKLALSISIALATIVISMNLGGVLYIKQNFPRQKGFEIEIPDAAAVAIAKKGLPEILNMQEIFQIFDVAKGATVFKKCAICHTDSKSGANKVGPNLWNIVGKKVAQNTSFSYSKAMLARSDKSWNLEELYRYLYAPKKYVPGTKMAFAGIKKDEDRVNLIAYLNTLSDSPANLPPAP